MDAGSARVELELGRLNNEIEGLKRERQEAASYIDKIRQVLPTLNQMSSSQEARIAESEQQIQDLQQKLGESENLKSQLQSKQNELASERSQLRRKFPLPSQDSAS